MPRFLLRALVFALLYMTLAACSGGGCGGGAIPPIRGGFPLPPTVPTDRRIPHAIQIRLSDQGLRAIETVGPSLFAGALGSGVAIPRTTTRQLGCDIVICPSGMCRIDVQLATMRPMELAFSPPDRIAVRLRLQLRTNPRNVPVVVERGCALTLLGAINGNLVIDTTMGSRSFIGLSTALRISRDTNAARLNYFRADIVSPTGSGDAVQETMGETIENADFDLNLSGFASILNFLIDLLKPQLLGQIRGQLTSALGPIQNALAHSSMPDPPGCPTGTTRDADRCLYPGTQPRDQRLVPLLLGTDGEGNFGSLLNSITPGIRAPNRFVVAAGDPAHGAEVSTTGATLNVFGTFESMRQAACVPAAMPPPLPTVPEYMALRSNVIPGTMTTVDLGIGVSEEFLNNALWNFWNSGMFCLGITSRLSQQVSAGLLTALPQLATIRQVIHPNNNAPLAIAFRPQRAPTARLGGGTNLMTDPLITLRFENLALDFFVWSEERYVRIFTLNSNLSIPINLTPGAMGLQPALGTVGVEMATVTNVALINAMPTQLADLLRELLGTIITQFAGSLPAVNLPSIPLPGGGGAMINIQIPAGGVRGVTEGSSRFLGLFANLRCTGGMCPRMNTAELQPTLRAQLLEYNPEVLRFDGAWRSDAAPRVRVTMGAVTSFGHPTEYRYRVDGGAWSEWTRESTMDIRSPAFALQGRHTIETTVRIVDELESESRTYASAQVLIDADAPTLTASRVGQELVASAHDLVSPDEAIEYQFSFDGRTQSWSRENRVTLPANAQNITVRARDEAGRIAERTVGANPVSDPLTIRGGPSTDTSGCGCTTPGGGTKNSRTTALLGTLGAALATSLFARRRRRNNDSVTSLETSAMSEPDGTTHEIKTLGGASLSSVVLRWGVVLSFFVGLGCNCGDPQVVGRDGGDSGVAEAGPDSSTQMCTDGARACPSMGNRCVAMPMCPACDPGSMAEGSPVFDTPTCTWRTAGEGACSCVPLPPLAQGMAGSHMDMAVHTDNTVWVSGYSAGDPFTRKFYGDLIVGRWNMAMSRVDWTHVDGVPAMGTVAGAVTGWRGGVDTPGPDVGKWNSIALDAMGRPRVSYWDATAEKLKFAAFDGTRWTTHVVDEGGQNGRYSSMVMMPGDVPMIAYRATTTDAMGAVTSEIRVARASSANPTRAADWMISRVFTAPTSCRANDCPMGQACLASGRCVATGSGCMPACAAGRVCVMNACQDQVGTGFIEDFSVGAIFPSLRVDAMGRGGVVFYHRDRGNLMGARFDGTMWTPAFTIVGEAMMRDEGDFGAWSSLAIAADGTWHVAYVDGYDETLNYVRVQNGMRMGMPEIIDDGSRVGMTAFDDGKHIVGDSVSISLDAMNNPRVVYQDSSVGTLRYASRGTMGWETRVLDMMGHTGYWARIRGNRVGTFFRDLRNTNAANRFGIRVTMAP
ncbi:MAG: hypothetical protein JNK05_08020 [Myxococcales bacterium]|nr:hypothetical protein [Myxococcales bacterium]